MPELRNELVYTHISIATYQKSNAKIINTGFHGRIMRKGYCFNCDHFPWNGPNCGWISCQRKQHFPVLDSAGEMLIQC